MKKKEFLKAVEDLAAQFRGNEFHAEIWLGAVVADRLKTQDSVSRAEIRDDLAELLTTHEAHPSFPAGISAALEKV